MEIEKEIRLNESQAKVKEVNPNIAYVMSPRGNGKTFIIGDRIEHLDDMMPRSQILLLSDTYKRLEEKIVPNICDYFINHAGMIENEDFVIYKKPPEHFVKPIIPLHKFEHVVSFSSGMALCLVSGNTEGDANAYNAQALLCDEAKFVKESHVKQASLVLRGSNKLFGELPEYRSKWFFTDKYPVPGSNIKWLLAKKEESGSPELIESIILLQRDVHFLEEAIETATSDAEKYPYIKAHKELTDYLNAVRKELTYYCDGKAYENIANLGEKYYRDQKRDLTRFEYKIAIENEDPDVVENAFYAALNADQHYHKSMNDIDINKPLGIALDFNWRITPMAVAQYGKLPGRQHNTFNLVAGLHTLSDGGIKQTCQAFSEQFSMMICKVVYFVFDQTAIGRSPSGDPFYKIVVDQLTVLGWVVIEIYIGAASKHDDRFKTFKIELAKTDEGAFLFNLFRCRFLLLSMQQAGATTASNGETKKDKSKEKKPGFPAEEATDYSEAFDILAWGLLQQNFLANTDTAADGAGLGFR